HGEIGLPRKVERGGFGGDDLGREIPLDRAAENDGLQAARGNLNCQRRIGRDGPTLLWPVRRAARHQQHDSGLGQGEP
ncbi:hypothetical protein ABTE36_23745, partial [Acinetobacter baumannii]